MTGDPAPGEAPKQRSEDGERQSTPGGSAAILGVRLVRYSGVQGTSMVLGSLLSLGSTVAVARYLGPAELGRFALLIFLAGLITQVFALAVRPGTIRRVFGAGDDEDDDDEEADTDVSESPMRSLGVGLLFGTVLALVAAAATIVWREPIADLLLGDPGFDEAVLWAGILGAAGILFKLASIIIWLERRPGAFMVADASRPVLGLAGVIIALSSGAGLEGAIAGTAIGASASALLCVALLRSSFEPALDLGEVGRIIAKGADRAPIIMSFWLVQNADVFLLSRFVDHTDLGIYTLASRLGFIASFLPQGFRVAMRAIRKTPGYLAFRDQYGRATASGQLLGYFVLICVTGVLAMVLAGEVLVRVAPSAFADAAGLIPFTAAAFATPALLRTTNQQTSWPGKTRRQFVFSAVGAALIFIGVSLLLMPEIGNYGAPLAMLAGFLVPSAYLFVRCQRSPNRIDFPYSEVVRAIVIAAAIGAGYALLPELGAVAEAAVAVALILLYFALLVVARVIPEYHWEPLLHMGRSVISGRAEPFNPRAGLRALDPAERAELRAAVVDRIPPERLAGGTAQSATDGAGEGQHLVRLLRRAGEGGGAPVAGESDHDGLIASFLFADSPIAVRDAIMRRLLAEGADSGDLRSLDDLVGHLARVPADAWEGESGGSRTLRRRVRPT